MQNHLFLEDLTLGQRFKTEAHTVDEAQIIAFAEQFDPQPFHTDAEAASHSLFGGLVASGWHTSALTMRLLVTSGPQIAGGLIGMQGQMEWPNPVRPGSVLHVEGEITEIVPSRSRPQIGIVTIRTETLNQNKEAVQIMTAKLVVPRRI